MAGSNNGRTTVIVAIISLIGTLGVALISTYRNKPPKTDPQPVVAIPPPAADTSKARATQKTDNNETKNEYNTTIHTASTVNIGTH